MNVAHFKYPLVFLPFFFFNIFLIFQPCVAFSGEDFKDQFNTLPPSPKGSSTPKHRSESVWEKSSSQQAEENALLRKGSSKNMNKGKEPLLSFKEELPLLIPEYTQMDEKKFNSHLKLDPEKTKKIILKISSDENHFKDLLKYPGWLVKLAVHPESALLGLGKKYFKELQGKHKNYPQLLIRKILDNPGFYEALFSLDHISIAQILHALQENQIKTIDQNLWKFVKLKKNDKSTSYEKALSVLIEHKHQEATKLIEDTNDLIREFVDSDKDFSSDFSLLFYTLPSNRRYALLSLCHFKGEAMLYRHPNKALELLEILHSFGFKNATIFLGLYYQHMGEYKKAKPYLIPNNLLCNLADIHEQLGEKAEAISCYQKVDEQNFLGKFRLMKLYDATEQLKESKKIKDQLIENLEKPIGYNAIEASVVAVLLGMKEAALRAINNGNHKIDAMHITPYHASLHLLSAFAKQALNGEALSHVNIVKEWAQKILKFTSKEGKISPLSSFSILTYCIGTYSLEYLAKTPNEEILKELTKGDFASKK